MNIQNAAPAATFVGWSNIPRIISQTLPHDKKWKVFVQSLPFFQMIHTFSIFTKYIYQEFNGSKIAKKVSSFQTLCLMIFNVICYGVNREVWQQLTSSAIL